MNASWSRELFKIGSAQGATSALLRVAFAVGVPLFGGLWIGHAPAAVWGGATALFTTLSDFGTTRKSRAAMMLAGWLAVVGGGFVGHVVVSAGGSNELVILASAFVAGWASGSHPGVAAVTRFFALAAAAATGLRFSDPMIAWSVVAGGVSAFVAAELVWWLIPLPPGDNVIDWRTGVQRAFHGMDSGWRFTLAYGAAAAVALFAAHEIGVSDAYWATLVVLMVMRREGVASFSLTLHYAIGTLAGVALAIAVLKVVDTPMAVALLATLSAALARLGLAINPSLGFVGFNLFILFAVHLATHGAVMDIASARLYDVAIGCVIVIVATLAISRRIPATSSAP